MPVDAFFFGMEIAINKRYPVYNAVSLALKNIVAGMVNDMDVLRPDADVYRLPVSKS